MLNLALATGPQDVSNLLQQLNTIIVALNASIGGLFGQMLTSTGNGADATDDPLATFVLPVGFFNFAGGLRIHASGSFAANNNAKSVKFKINDTATVVSMVGLNAVGANSSGKSWKMDAYVGRSSASHQSFDWNYIDTLPSTNIANGTATEVETNAWTITVTGTSGASAANDVLCQTATLEVLR